MSNHTLSLPAVFFEDHLDRCPSLDGATVVLAKGRSWKVSISEADLGDLYSDARHYSSFQGVDFADNRSVCSSAKATVRNLEKRFSSDELAGFSRAATAAELVQRAQRTAEREAFAASPAGIAHAAVVAAQDQAAADVRKAAAAAITAAGKPAEDTWTYGRVIDGIEVDVFAVRPWSEYQVWVDGHYLFSVDNEFRATGFVKTLTRDEIERRLAR